ncbi:hypothetical protein C5167_026771 [Papaver somniferum]|nr:hypothetical protein C5167_026771 [Papaver somniferum]
MLICLCDRRVWCFTGRPGYIEFANYWLWSSPPPRITYPYERLPLHITIFVKKGIAPLPIFDAENWKSISQLLSAKYDPGGIVMLPSPRYCLKMVGVILPSLRCSKQVVGDNGSLCCSRYETNVEMPISSTHPDPICGNKYPAEYVKKVMGTKLDYWCTKVTSSVISTMDTNSASFEHSSLFPLSYRYYSSRWMLPPVLQYLLLDSDNQKLVKAAIL